MKIKRMAGLCLLFCLLAVSSFAQDSSSVEMADVLRSNGKIYVVVAVCLTILCGLFIYVMRIERKIRKIENNENN